MTLSQLKAKVLVWSGLPLEGDTQQELSDSLQGITDSLTN